MKIDWKKALLFPVVIYAIAFLVASAFVAFKVETAGIVPWIVTTAAVLITAFILAKRLDLQNTKQALIYGVIWIMVLVVLDLAMTIPFTGIEYFYDWKAYLGYVLVFLMPAIVHTITKK